MKKILIVILFYLGISSVISGIELIRTDGLGMPKELLLNSPFSDFLIPGLILIFVIGGTSMVASYLLLTKRKNAIYGACVAGFGVVIWIFVQQYMINQSSPLQILYFSIGIIILILSIMQLRSNQK